MKVYIVWALIIQSAVLALGNGGIKPDVRGFLLRLSALDGPPTVMDYDAEEERLKRSDDYSDEGGFVPKKGNGNDDDFIANIQSCAGGYARAPWGKCIPCAEYEKKFRVRCP
ncbi:uncharacterized protein LOC119837935 [Zerene cesonia]|uniref:uncharacterized protein LOC119837935 n=1 Tax=Zerene cesonia TaxID=33412 RepID=UPI0018E4DDCE|nr:uncharacterized protein LOC119837935 [Zerene cesonia]